MIDQFRAPGAARDGRPRQGLHGAVDGEAEAVADEAVAAVDGAPPAAGGEL